VAVALHEIPQEISDYALLIYSGYTRRAALLLNFLSALTAVLGAALTLVASEFMTGLTDIIVPLAAGNLLYIAGSDLIPELHKHARLRQGMLQLAGIVAGIAVMYAMLWLE
jgi:zinc and cadmium transporter